MGLIKSIDELYQYNIQALVIHVIISAGECLMEEWLTTFEASKISGYELDYIRKLIRAQNIIGRKWGQSWQVNRKSLLHFLKQRETQGEKRGRKPVHHNSKA